MDERRRNSSRWVLSGLVLVAAVGSALHLSSARRGGVTAHSSAPPSTASMSTRAVSRFKVPVTASQPVKGSAEALVTIVEWCNLLGPECEAVDPIVDAVLKEYGDRVRLVFRHYLPASAPPVADEFARIAFEQAGKFWEARDLLRQGGTETPSPAQLEGYAKQLGLDWNAARAALAQHTHTGHVVADRLFAEMFDVHAVPAFFVNGRRVAGEATLPAFKAVIDDEIQRATQLVAHGVPKNQIYAELTKNGTWKQLSATRPN
jgi:protein-disulfide isomerase